MVNFFEIYIVNLKEKLDSEREGFQEIKKMFRSIRTLRTVRLGIK
jgi:hypothetical protein